MHRLIFLSLLFVTIWSGLATAESTPNVDNQCQALGRSMMRYHIEHLTKRMADQDFAQRVSDLMLRSLDGQKALILKSDAEKLRAQIEAFTLNPDRSCTFFNDLLEQRRQWATGMSEYVDKVLSDSKLKLDRTLKVNTDPDVRSRPQTLKEQQQLRHSRVHDQ